MSTSIKIPGGCAVGAFVNGMENIAPFQKMIGKKLAAILWYNHWFQPFPAEEIKLVDANGSLPLITWEPWVTDPLGALDAISSGNFKLYVENFLQAAKKWGKPILLRFAHEMNGNWYPWDGFHNGEKAGPDKYKRAWHYIYDVKRQIGADNVQLVWCPNHSNQPEAEWNALANYYPGDAVVDWVGLDGYNWGYSAWQDFDSIFKAPYNVLANLTGKPIMIGEFGCADQGGSKADWITDTLAKIETNYPRLKLFCWFNINKERDWRVDSSAPAASAFKNSLQSDHFLDKIPACCI